MSGYRKPRKALLILDIQEDFTGSKARMPVDRIQAESMIENVNMISVEARRKDIEVIYIKNGFPGYDVVGNVIRRHAAMRNSPGCAFDKRLMVINENIFSKCLPDAFSNRAFEMFLMNEEINELYMTGVFAERCVLSTARGALKRGFIVHVIRDAVASATMAAVERAALKLEKLGASILDTAMVVS